MKQTISPTTGKAYGLQRVCRVWSMSRSTYYAKEKQRVCQRQGVYKKRGPKTHLSDQELLERIQMDIKTSPFKGEGHRKIHARLKRKIMHVGKNRLLKIMKEHSLLSPHRKRSFFQNPHDGTIITTAPNVMWGSDGTKIWTIDDGWVWIFSVEEHWNGECLGWHVCKIGDRFAALEPVTQAVKKVYGSLSKGIAHGLKLRIDHGSQYTSDYFLQQIAYMGIENSFGLVRQPQTNGVAERFHRTLKDQILDGKAFHNIEEVRSAMSCFVKQYNEKWLMEKLGYKSPLEASKEYYNTEMTG